MTPPDDLSPDISTADQHNSGLVAVVATAVSLGITALLIATDAFDTVVELLRAYEEWQLDELLLGVVVGIVIFSVMKYQGLRLRCRTQQQELSRQQRLLRRVADLSDGLVLHNRDLERAVWIMSREFGEPLRTIQRQMQHFSERWSNCLDDQEAHNLSQCHSAIQRINGLSQALGDYLGNSSGNLLCHPVECLPLIQEILHALPPGDAACIHVEALPKVFAHHGELLRVLRHLIKNAIRFRREDRPLSIRIGGRDMDLFYCLEVEDNGIGISAENLEAVFRLIPNVNKQATFDGHGLGLASCRRAVHRMNGRLWLEQSPSGGCLFRLRLPKG